MKIISHLRVAVAAFFVVLSSVALAQNSGTVTNHAFAIGKGPGVQGFTSLPCASAQLAVGQSADPICKTITGDVTITAAGVTALGNIPSGTTGAGNILNSNIAAPSTPASGKVVTWTDSTDLRFHDKNASGIIGTTVVGYSSIAHQFLTGMNNNGAFAGAQPAFTDISGSATLAQLPAGTSDTALGYWGSTVASALAINNCSNALTYSTSTHTFGCNTTAGTGTVTTTGSPVANQFALMSGATSITGTSAAAKSDQQAGTSAILPVTPSQQQSHDSSLKAHGLFTGSTGALASGYNMGSATHTAGSGTYVIPITPTGFASANYDCTVSVESTGITSTAFFAIIAPGKTASSITVNTISFVGGNADPTGALDVQCAGRQ
jgi:hypothetical protein